MAYLYWLIFQGAWNSLWIFILLRLHFIDEFRIEEFLSGEGGGIHRLKRLELVIMIRQTMHSTNFLITLIILITSMNSLYCMSDLPGMIARFVNYL